jgi:signal transduction histidine kinase
VGRLAAGIAHEVGNPLAAIVGLTDVLKEGGLSDAEVKDFATRVGREAERIHRTVRELLDYARAAPPDETTPSGDAADAIAHVARLLEPQKAMREVTLTREVAADLPAVRLPTDRIEQVLLNLALNAGDAIVSANEAGKAHAIALRAFRDGSSLVLEVEDDGPGIPEAIRERVFEPFFTTKAAGQGTGLGLAICAVIVEQAGGSIAARARRDGARGARMEVRLPIA